MMPEMESLKASMDLLKIKTENIIERKECGILLKDDIWGKGTLILKSGAYLTEEIINKLLKFGVNKVNVSIDDSKLEEDTVEEQKYIRKQFIGTQSVLIVDKDLFKTSIIVRNLIDNGFKEGNIFVTKELSSINSYFRAKKINFLFIDGDLYENCKKCVEKYSLLKNTHTFILISEKASKEFKIIGVSKIKFLLKPVIEEKLNNLISDALNQNFLDFWSEEEVLIS